MFLKKKNFLGTINNHKHLGSQLRISSGEGGNSTNHPNIVLSQEGSTDSAAGKAPSGSSPWLPAAPRQSLA